MSRNHGLFPGKPNDDRAHTHDQGCPRVEGKAIAVEDSICEGIANVVGVSLFPKTPVRGSPTGLESNGRPSQTNAGHPGCCRASVSPWVGDWRPALAGERETSWR